MHYTTAVKRHYNDLICEQSSSGVSENSDFFSEIVQHVKNEAGFYLLQN